MREINNIKIIGVDAGYGNIKTANTVTPTGIIACDTQPIFNGSILEYEASTIASERDTRSSSRIRWRTTTSIC